MKTDIKQLHGSVKWEHRSRSRVGVAVIYGGQPLNGCTVEAEELRGGAALVIAALAAQGITRIRGCCFIERGYEHICEDLTALGGLLIKDRGTL